MTATARNQAHPPARMPMLEGASGLRIEKLEGRDAFNALERDWNAALAQPRRADRMLGHEGFRAGIETSAPPPPFRVFAAREAGQWVAPLPLGGLRSRSAYTRFLPLTPG